MSSNKRSLWYKLRSGTALNIIGAIVLMLIVFGIVVSIVGLTNFTNAFENEYSTTTYHMASTATYLVNGDNIEKYLTADPLSGELRLEYLNTKSYLDAYCVKMNVSLVYVIFVDTSDYGRFVSVFNSVNNTVDNSNYTEWELGHKRDTTNDEYRRKYEAIYKKEVPYETVYRKNPTDGSHSHITTLVPVKDSKGKVTGILCIQRPMSELENSKRPYIVTVALSTLMLALTVSVFYAIFIRKQFVKPLARVAAEATRFAKENTKSEPLGRVSRFKEISELSDSIDTMETDMVKYIENLTAVTAEKERISVELSLASTIQENSVPNIFPPFPERTDFDIYASMTPAKEVGGDFYNFFFTDDDHLAFYIGDVSGKGIPAALFMMVTNILISDRTRMGGTPGEILTFVNHNICEHNTADMFVTLWLGIIDLTTGTVTASNAGHEYPAIRHPNGKFELFKDKHSLAVGAMDGVRYKDYTLQLEPGSKLFIYTDGVPEATDEGNNMFGSERMLDTLNSDPEAPPETVLANIRNATDAFIKGAKQFDDLTMLCFEYKGKKS